MTKHENIEPTLYRSNVELIEHEVTWLINRLGNKCHIVLEPGCGSGRMLEAFAKRDIEIMGLDSSKDGIALAQKRISAMPYASAILGDMTKFDLGRIFDGAICPINTLAILSPDGLAQHLDCMSRHLSHNARYLVQVAIRDEKSELDDNSI